MLEQGAAELGPEITTPTGPNRYRPPAGFMNEDGPQENPEILRMEPAEMVAKLGSRAGRWHNLAKLLQPLYQSGYDAKALDELTGITPVVQNRWIVAATVYDSLVASGKVGDDALRVFDGQGDELLYPFRFLTQDMRVEAALYLVEQRFDPPMCEVLARAMKEWERRPTERDGFSPSPADCLAFKYLRDALECRRLEEAEKKFKQALQTAGSDPARARVQTTWDAYIDEDAARRGLTVKRDTSDPTNSGITTASTLTILRLDPEELGVRPIPIVGALGAAAPATVSGAPRTSQEGAFGAFSIAGGSAAATTWVALPQWKALAMMRHPVALSVPDCSAVSAVVASCKCKNDDDKRRLAGSGLVVADVMQAGAVVEDDAFYMAAPSPSVPLQLADGIRVRAQKMTPVAVVSFLARPPAREGTTDSQIQL